MASFLERLRAALAGRYEVEREIGRGGMGTVFLGRDPRLNRAVAIKALRPEDHTATVMAHFQQEAQLLAELSHPNIVPIYDTGIANGIGFYVMEYLTGQTLEERLGQDVPLKPLPPREAARLGLDLLAALAFAHRHGVVHRDVKPSNIVFRHDDALLTDFGIAKSLVHETSDTLRTRDGVRKGTLDYMSPEQLAGKEVSPRSDVYSAAVVLYLAYTGRLRAITDRAGVADQRVPPRVRRVLARALQFEAERRWQDGEAFRRAFARALLPAHASRWVPWVIGAAVIAGLTMRAWPGRNPLPVADVVIAPFSTVNTADLALGREVSRFTALALPYFPKVRVVDPRAAFSCWDAPQPGRSHAPRSRCRLGAHYVVEGTLSGRGDSVDVDLTMFDRNDEVVPIRHVTGLASVSELTSAVATTVLRALVTQDSSLGPVDTVTITFCGRRVEALAALSQGEEAFQRDDWIDADQDYQRALTLDPACALAAWRLSVVRAWRRMPVGVDLRGLYNRQHAALPPVVRSLLAAQLAPSGPDRLAAYRTAVAAHPGDSYAWLLYGNELWSRGALAGVDLAAADTALRKAVTLDRSVPVYDHIAWLNIRLGNAAAARAALASIPPGPRGDVDLPRLLQLGYILRFVPESAKIDSSAPDTMLNDIAKAVRFGLTVDVPAGQVLFGKMLAAAPGITSNQRADGHEAEGVALVMLGRTDAALAQLDSAAMLRGPAAGIEPAEWRLLLGSLGLPAPPAAEVARARATLRRLTADRALGARAAWDLAVAAYADGDTTAAVRWTQAFDARDRGDSAAGRALTALQLGARGRLADAAAAARPLGWMDSDHLRNYPFLRSLVHLRQGAWLTEQGDAAAADSAWLWYDNADAAQWPIGPAQAGDVDWALATYARLLRARTGGPRCRLARRVAELWAGADPAYAPLLAEARTLAERCRS